jgi:hypothetical protein
MQLLPAQLLPQLQHCCEEAAAAAEGEAGGLPGLSCQEAEWRGQRAAEALQLPGLLQALGLLLQAQAQAQAQAQELWQGWSCPFEQRERGAAEQQLQQLLQPQQLHAPPACCCHCLCCSCSC